MDVSDHIHAPAALLPPTGNKSSVLQPVVGPCADSCPNLRT